MLPISSTATQPAPAISPAAQANAAEAAALVSPDAPPSTASVVDLSPLAQFLSNVSQARQQLNQLQAAVANGTAPSDPAEQASRLTDVAQHLVTAFNLLPAVDFNQGQPQGASLLNNLVQSLTQQTAAGSATQDGNAAQALARIGVTLQAPLLSDAAGGLSLDSQILRTAFSNDRQATTATLQQTIATFGEEAARFAQQLSAAGTNAAAALAPAPQPALTAEDLAASLRLDAARAQLAQLASTPAPDTGADRLAAQRAAQDQLATTPAVSTAGSLSANPALQAATTPDTAPAAATQAATQAANTAAAAAQSAAADLNAANAAQARAAEAAAAEAAAQHSFAVQEAVNQANASQSNAGQANQNPAGPADPLRANPALAGAIAAYNINDTARAAAGGRAAQTSANAVRPVRRVDAVGAIDTGQAPPT
jgi:hypothetical protein